MNKSEVYCVQYDNISSINLDELVSYERINVYFDIKDTSTLMLILEIYRDTLGNIVGFDRLTQYNSLKEFSTLGMKEALTLYAKNSIINSDKKYYKTDDPKLHSFLSKLPYNGIETVCEHLNEFSDQFKNNNITLNLRHKNTSNFTKKPVKITLNEKLNQDN